MRSLTYVVAVMVLLAGCGGGGGSGIPAGIDLITQSIIAPEYCDWGDVINVDVILMNRGKTDSTNTWTVEVRLSTDQTIDGTDTLLKTYTVSGLAALIDLPQTDSISIPVSGTAGVYFLGYTVDATDVETEDIETNNITVSSTIYIGPATKPDFEASNFSGPDNQVSGQSFGTSVDVINKAVPYLGAVQVSVYLSTDSTIDPATDTLIGSATMFNVPYDLPTTKPVGCMIDWTTDAGDYYVGPYIDPGNAVVEENEANNSTIGKAIHIERGPDDYEADNDEWHATTLVLNGPAQIHDFYPAQEHDWFKFDIPAGVTDVYIYIVDYLGDGTNPDVTVYDSDMVSMGTFAGLGDELLRGSGLPAGTYYLDVTQCLYTGTPVLGGRYQIYITTP